VTGRIFTAAEHAQNHCQVGNWGLALREMVKWMSSLENADPGNREVEAAGAHARAVRKPH